MKQSRDQDTSSTKRHGTSNPTQGKTSFAVNKVYCTALTGLTMGVLSCLTLLAITATKCYPEGIPDVEVASSLNKAIPFISLIIGMLFVATIYQFRKKILLIISNVHLNKLYLYQTIIIAAFGLIIVFAISAPPRADQYYCINWAELITNGQTTILWHNQEWLNRYLQIWPHQAGWILFLSVFGSVFGFYNWTAYKVFNLLMILVSLFVLNKLTELILQNKMIAVISIVISTLFVPFLMFVQFVYGFIPACAFCLIATYTALLFFQTEDTKKKIILYIITVLSITIAIWLKSNSIVFLIGIATTIAVKMICEMKPIYLLFIATLVLSYVVTSPIPSNILEEKTGLDLDRGTPQLAWVVMGMQEGKLGSGWYNGYVWNVSEDNNGNLVQMEEQINSDLAVQISDFVDNPAEAVRFFLNKTMSEWSEPTFESLWITQINYQSSPQYSEQDSVAINFLSGKSYYLYILFCDILQSLVYVFALYGVIKLFKESNPETLCLLLIFIGGAILHLFWEAKSYYVLFYFMLLIPYAANGLKLFLQRKNLDKESFNSQDN